MEPGELVAIPGGEGGRLETGLQCLFHFHFLSSYFRPSLLLSQFVDISGVEEDWRHLCLYNHVGSSSNPRQSQQRRQVGLQLLQALWL